MLRISDAARSMIPSAAVSGRVEISDEVLVVLLCARAKLQGERRENLSRLLYRGVAWDEVIAFASRHRLIPILYHHLSSLAERIPPATMQRLRDQAQSRARQNLWLSRELVRIIKILEAEGIRCASYKGPCLAVVGFGDLALRSFRDIDVLVKAEDVLRAGRVLRGCGYAQEMPLRPSEEPIYLHSECELNFVSPSGVQVELHWAVAPRYCVLDIPSDLLWTRHEPVEIAGTPVASLAPEALLLALCIHNLKHGWQHLSMVADVAALIEARPQMDWERVAQATTRMGAWGVLRQGLTLANRYFGTDLPEQIRSSTKGAKEGEAAVSRVWAPLVADSKTATAFDSHRGALLLRSRERFRDRVRFIMRLLFVPNAADLLFVNLPESLCWAYRILRIVRMAMKLAAACGLVSKRWLEQITFRHLCQRVSGAVAAKPVERTAVV